MQRVAVVAPRAALRSVLVEVADAGTVDLDDVPGTGTSVDAGPAVAALQHQGGRSGVSARIVREAPDVDELSRVGSLPLLAGEAELEQRAADALVHDRVATFLGWMPRDAIDELRQRIEPYGGAVAPLPLPRGVEPPTLLSPRREVASFRLLIDTYGTVRYADVDPTLFAVVAFALMFGMMFGDVGHGLVLVTLGLLARRGRLGLGRARSGWALAVAAGVAATGFGFAYGEAFGPTHLVPALWLVPLDDPVRLLVVGVLVGAVLLGLSQIIGVVNRWREGGASSALYAPSGGAGLCLYTGLLLLAAGVYEKASVLTIVGASIALIGVAVAFAGSYVTAGGRGVGLAEAAVESLDGVVRLGSNLVSFARLAAFGLMHAAIGLVIWEATTALWHPGPSAVFAAAIFLIGNVVAFALEALVVGVQALRLEYYELFSRIFGEEGRPFRPWHVELAPADTMKEVS